MPGESKMGNANARAKAHETRVYVGECPAGLELRVGKAGTGEAVEGKSALVLWAADPKSPQYPGIKFRSGAVGPADGRFQKSVGASLQVASGALLNPPFSFLLLVPAGAEGAAVPPMSITQPQLHLALSALAERVAMIGLGTLVTPVPAFGLDLKTIAASLTYLMFTMPPDTPLRTLRLYSEEGDVLRELGDWLATDPRVKRETAFGGPPPQVNQPEEKKAKKGEEEPCCVCMCEMEEGEVKALKCSHRFHTHCIERAFQIGQPKCPVCFTWEGVPYGTQPDGDMNVQLINQSCPGHKRSGTIVITYSLTGGVQTERDPRPGVPFSGTSRVAYLPDTEHGRVVLELLRLAWDLRIIFTVGDSVTSGAQNTTVWNNIHHKTSMNGGPQGFGYPDPTYLERVEMELASQGVTRQLIGLPPPE